MINFTKYKNTTLTLSLIISIMLIICIIKINVNLSLEFTGGVEIEITSEHIIDINQIKQQFITIKDAKIKYYGSNKTIIVKVKNTIDNLIVEKIKLILKENMINAHADIIRLDYIGSEITKDTIYNSIIAIIAAMISMSLYLTYRFKYTFAISAILTLCHDIIILLGIISILKIELNLTILTALFAVFGYSINDTVVIFDRIREYKKKHKDTKLKILINASINSTLSRTIITSTSTLIVSIILMFTGGDILFDFALILSLGIIIGTYSSIYIAAMLILLINRS